VGYENLTGEKWTLSEKKTLINEKAIGWRRKTKIFECSKCKNLWKVFEEFDSYHGHSYFALRIGEATNS